MSTEPHRRNSSIELLSPAGDWQCVRAAIENGADAIYFGLDCGFNARFRAKNFGLQDLPELTRTLRSRGVRGYVTLNTLAFPSEMHSLVDVITEIATAGIDAVLVQDFGVARLVREICPELEIHASTQMSLTSAETIHAAADLGLSRVVLARELSVAEIRKIASKTDMPLEVFIHGALCVAYSGQCLTSESLGGRSANRGQCAQACRLPYELVCDGEDRDLGDVKYLLSPQDLAGYAAIPDLIDAGVASIKIEGRLKTPEYVANITRHYRQAIDDAIRSGQVNINETDRREMELSFSRGFSPGWLEGNDHKQLVPGLHSAKRGIPLGRILKIERERIQVAIEAPVALGDGVAILDGDSAQGGRIYDLENAAGHPVQSQQAGEITWIGFGREEIRFSEVELGAAVFKNDDPKLNRRLRRSFSGEDPNQRQPLDMTVIAKTDETLRLKGQLSCGSKVEVTGKDVLSVARKHPIDEETLREKLGRLGGTPFVLGRLEAIIEGQPMVPMAMLNGLRRELVEAIERSLAQPPSRDVSKNAGLRLLDPIERGDGPNAETKVSGAPKLAVLCRTMEQLDAVCDCGIDFAYVDFHDVRLYRDAIKLTRQNTVPIAVASVRIQKPGEMGLLRVLLRHPPDAILARNLAAIAFARENSIPFIADFSMNVTNHRSAEWVREVGTTRDQSQPALRVTGSYDLNRDQLLDLVRAVPAKWLEVVIHQHMPMFHMEHCVFCSVLSPGSNKTNCGRPCDDHVVQLRDRVGAEHPLQADVACRNTLYNSTPQSGAEVVPDLVDLGVQWFRLELLEEDAAATTKTVSIYKRLLAGEISGPTVWKKLKAANRLGVTRGTLETKRNPLAIL